MFYAVNSNQRNNHMIVQYLFHYQKAKNGFIQQAAKDEHLAHRR